MATTTTSTITRRDEQLLDAVITEVMRRPRATLAELAEAAGVGRTTLFKAYATRAALIEACGVRACTVVVSRLDRVDTTAADGGLAELVEGLIPLGPQLDFLWRTPVLSFLAAEEESADDLLGELARRYTAGLDAVIHAARDAGAIRSDLPDWWSVQLVQSVIYVAWEEVDGGRLAPRGAPELALRTLLEGIGGAR